MPHTPETTPRRKPSSTPPGFSSGLISRGRQFLTGRRKPPAISGGPTGDTTASSRAQMARDEALGGFVGSGGSFAERVPAASRGATAMAALSERFKGRGAVAVRPDGLFQVDLGEEGVLLYDIDAQGNPLRVKDPEAAGTGGSGMAARAQALSEAEFIRDTLSSGRDFLAAAALTRGFRSNRVPVTQADMIAGVGGGGSLPSISNLRGFGSTSEFPGAAPAGGGFSPPGSQADIVALSQESAPPAVRNTIEGRLVPQFRTNIPLPSPDTLGSLTEDEAGALNTALLAEQGITAEELAQESQRRFRGGRGIRTGAVR